MSGDRYFIDSNIVVYMYDRRDPGKQAHAKQLLKEAFLSESGCISYQVIQESLNVFSRKETQLDKPVDLSNLLEEILDPLCCIYPSTKLFRSALDIKNRWRYSFYDSLIIAAALEANCKMLYSEDLQHQQKIETLTIINPFK